MCGLAGILTVTRQVYADDFLSDSFVASMLRGTDSSGIVQIDLIKTTYEMQKLPVSGLFFKEDRVAKRLMVNATDAGSLAMCHVRAATVGNVSLSNAHPFEIVRDNGDVLLGTHNGTLTNWRTQATAKHYDVDSEWALSHIATEGLDAFKDITGAYAFVWWDGGDRQVLHMARNKERSLYIAFLKDGSMAYASEAGMLYWLLERNNMKIEGSILALDPDKHYMFPVTKPSDFTKEDLPEREVKQWGGGYHGPYSSNSTTYYKTTVDKVKEVIEGSEQTVTLGINAHPSEQRLARDYGWFGAKAVFTHIETDKDGNCVGIAEADRTEFDAIIRGDWTHKFDPNDEWMCTVLGVQEDDKDLILVLSEPYRTIPVTLNLEE